MTKDSTYWRAVLCAFIGITVAGNTGHVLLVGAEHPIPAAALAAVPPLALVLITHGLTGRVGRGGGGVFWVGAIGAVAVAGGAFWISWVTLRDLTAQLLNCGPAVASVMPLIIDVTIAVASAMAVAAHRRELVHVHQESAGQVVRSDAEPAHQPGVQVLTTAPAAVLADTTVTAGATAAAQRTGVLTRTVDAHVHQQDGAQPITAPEAAQEPVVDTAQEVATSDDAGDVAEQSTESAAMSTEVSSSESGRVLALVHRPDAQRATGAQEGAAQQVRSVQRDGADGAQVAQDVELDPAQEATRLIERGSSRLDEETLTDVIARIARGESHNSIAGTTGVSRNTVMRLAGMVPTEPDDGEEASA